MKSPVFVGVRGNGLVSFTLVLVLMSTAVFVFGGSTGAAAAYPQCDTEHTFQHTSTGGNLAAPVSSGNNANCVLGRGSSGHGVTRLQWVLNKCYNAGLATDGIYGAKTEAAIRWLQSEAGISKDGVYGPVTRNNMMFPVYGIEQFFGCFGFSVVPGS
ncbi:peptidoglycan-binding domain-containing protein [Solwaraspora sp. WMMA2065]|uniref:peptidoglycan-binding domain-containing protein n=1 Tax=Solwaraspora sp. WMMA2065 TaxID=3015166 RepID=UPI00259AF2C9|nr:peptidoglycan-binding domain-containing protein [Solwaraspora sp. WMMA2065]WJK37482.1 peptidoglycan-binding domain-containing protein [Solwaraspora sp. WMMA2065]